MSRHVVASTTLLSFTQLAPTLSPKTASANDGDATSRDDSESPSSS